MDCLIVEFGLVLTYFSCFEMSLLFCICWLVWLALLGFAFGLVLSDCCVISLLLDWVVVLVFDFLGCLFAVFS